MISDISSLPMADNVVAVVIGRNEGQRLVQCLASLQTAGIACIVYVDSGSEDDSVAKAARIGAEVVELDMSRPFTAARARNAGFARAMAVNPATAFVQFVDGDCVIQPNWIAQAREFLLQDKTAAVACGRVRERFPENSIYNRLLDAEWDTPVGQLKACGGIAMMRVAALQETGGFNPKLIAGEEPELCLRLRTAGWTIWRLDAEMTLHDAAMTRFSQWWKRTRRAGFTYAEGAAMHGRTGERYKVAELRRAVAWGLALPILTVIGLFLTPWAWLLLLAWPLQMLRLRQRGFDWARSVFLTIGKLSEAQGVLRYWIKRLSGRTAELIEYK